MKPTTADDKAKLACTLASLILADENIKPTGEKISQILGAAKVEVAPYWPGLFVKAFSGQDINSVIFNAPLAAPSSAAAAAPAAAAASSAEAAPAAETKEEKKKEESEADVGAGGLFGDDAGADY